MRGSILAFASGAAAQTLQLAAGQSAQFLASNPGGAVPENVQAPSIAGFTQPTIQPSRGGQAVCVSGIVPVQASTTMNMNFNFEVPQNQSGVTQTFVSMLTSGSPFMEQLMGDMASANGTYNISATLCTPANNTRPDTVQILTHGVGFDRYASFRNSNSDVLTSFLDTTGTLLPATHMLTLRPRLAMQCLSHLPIQLAYS